MGYWMDNVFFTGKHYLLDVGYVKNQTSREHADQIMKFVSRRNVEIVAYGRILIRIPPSKLSMILEKFSGIVEGEAYAWTTHKWPFDGWDDIKYAYGNRR